MYHASHSRTGPPRREYTRRVELWYARCKMLIAQFVIGTAFFASWYFPLRSNTPLLTPSAASPTPRKRHMARRWHGDDDAIAGVVHGGLLLLLLLGLDEGGALCDELLEEGGRGRR